MTKSLGFLARFLVVLSLVVVTSRAASMKLLTPETGWALMGPGLMWTTDGGNTWTNITPPLQPGEYIAAVYFSPAEDGWALLAGPEDKSGEPRLDLAGTSDAGQSWSVTPITIPQLNPRSFLLEGGGYIYFLDELHGWINLSLVSSAAVRGAILIETQDGGATWRWVNSPGRAGPIHFTSTADGWLSGGPADQLYVTRDGANTWHDVTLQPPPQAGRAIYPTYGLPVFQNGEDGFLPVTFTGAGDVHSVLVMFRTSDGGRSWVPDAFVPGLQPTSLGEPWPTSIANSTLITGSTSDQSFVLTRASRGGTLTASAAVKLPYPVVAELSFVDSLEGWAVLAGNGGMGRLYSTSDGGNTWADITPRPVRKAPPSGNIPKLPLSQPPSGM
jgi:photosystem II stability/assembly factor-like uncharacterized protein